MFRFVVPSVCLLPLLLVCENAEAQIVRIGGFGGVSVRAPFVAVDVSPYGGTHVRAPFTRVNTGVYRYGSYYRGYYPPYYSYYPYPRVVYGGPVVYAPPPVAVYSPPVAVYEPVLPYPPVEAAAPVVTAQYPLADASQLPGRLRSAAARLAQSLSLRHGDVDVWLDYLGPELIVDVIDRGADPSTLRDLVANYDGVVSNGSLISIRSASGFSETRSLLRQYVSGAAASAAKPAVPTPPQPPADTPPEPNREDSEPVPPPLPVPPPPTEPDLPRAQAEPTPAESIKTATGGEVPTPL